jgi:hypothetical protein
MLAASVELQVLDPATDIIKNKLIDNFIIRNTPNLTSQHSYVTVHLTSLEPRTLISRLQLKTFSQLEQTPSITLGQYSIPLLQDIMIVNCQLWLGRSNDKSQVWNIFFLHPVVVSQ